MIRFVLAGVANLYGKQFCAGVMKEQVERRDVLPASASVDLQTHVSDSRKRCNTITGMRISLLSKCPYLHPE